MWMSTSKAGRCTAYAGRNTDGIYRDDEIYGFYIPPGSESEFENNEIVKVAEGVVIYDKHLKRDLHVYALDYGDTFIPTAEEVEGLYNKYDQDIYKRFYQFFDWYRNNGGAACDAYVNAMLQVDFSYTDKHGSHFKNIESWSDYTVEDLIDLESYVKENPDYSNTDITYQRLLKWLGVEKK